jgi:LPXTG-motif cell wall-anchored protein
MAIRRSLQVFVAVVVAVAALALANPAGAVDNPGYTAPPPSSVVQTSTPAPLRQVQTAAAPQRLAITGSDSLQLAVLGALLIVGGAGALVARRRATA